MDYLLFSADDHVDAGSSRLDYLPADLWLKRVPSAYKARAPRLEKTPQGNFWFVDGKRHGPAVTGINPVVGKDAVALASPGGQWRPTTPALRLADMDRDRVEGHVLYGSPSGLFAVNDDNFAAVIVQAYNQWIADISSVSPNRLIGLGVLPGNAVGAAIEELRHCAKLGLRGVQFNPFLAYAYPWDPVWEPLWSEAEEIGIPVSFHLSAGVWSCGHAISSPPGSGKWATLTTVVPTRLDEVLCSLILCGALKRHPKLRVVLGESGLGWIPYILDRMDLKYQERHIMSKRDDAADLELMPSDYYRRQMFATFQEDRIGIKFIDFLGANTVMWASDYPHADSVWPRSHETVEALFKGMDSSKTRMILRENALKLYS